MGRWVNGKLIITVPLDGVEVDSPPKMKASALFRRLEPLSELIDDQDAVQVLRSEDVEDGEPLDPEIKLSKVRERLLSNELVEAVAKAEYEDDMGREWPPVMDYQRAEWLDDARKSLAFAADSFPQEPS